MSGFGEKRKRQIAGGKYHWKLQDWVNQLFIKYDRCAICGTKHDLEPHHVVKVKPYDNAYASVDNGVILCKRCHRKYHEMYNGDINAASLLEFARR